MGTILREEYRHRNNKYFGKYTICNMVGLKITDNSIAGEN